MRKIFAILALVTLVSLPVAASAFEGAVGGAVTWNVDTNHSEVSFSVKHFFTPVKGSFRDFEVKFQFDKDNPANSIVEAKIAIASVSTGNERRDAHLRTADWFEADKYPYMTFKSTSVSKVGDNQYVARGPLTIKGITREVEMPIEVLGVQMIPEQMRGMMGGITEAASFHAELDIRRNDFNVGTGTWAGTMVVGGNVKVEIIVEATHK